MKKYTIIYVLLINCLVSVSVYGQYYENNILLQGDFVFQEAWQVIAVNDTTYTILVHPRMDNDSFYGTGILFVNNYGQLIDTVFYERGISNYAATDMLPNQLGYAIIVVKDPDNYGDLPGYPVFLQVDTQGQVLYEHEAVDTINYKVVEQMVRTPEDGGYLAVGRVLVNDMGEYKPYVIKFNANGEKQWDRIYTQYLPNQDNIFNDVVRTANGEYYAVGGNELETNTVGSVFLAHLDPTNGNIMQQWNYNFDSLATNNQSLDDGTKLIALDNGGFIIGVKKENVPQWGSLLRLNSNKEVVWVNNQVLNDCGPRKVLYLPTDGSFVTTGCATVLYPEVSNGVQVEISKVSAAGNLVWKRHYGVDGADDYAWDMINTPDGGFMVVGRSYSFFWQQTPIYLLKTNCMGLLTEPQAAFAAQIDTAALRITLQNLSQYTYPDSIDGGHYIWDFGDGTTSTEINPTHTYAQGGNYSVTLTAVVCSDTSVFVQEVSTWATGIEASPLPPPKEGEMQEGEIRVLPNPANEQISINSVKPLSGIFVLYDVLGKEVARQVLLANGTSVKTQHLPSGIYLYQIINPQNQTLQHGKLSILH